MVTNEKARPTIISQRTLNFCANLIKTGTSESSDSEYYDSDNSSSDFDLQHEKTRQFNLRGRIIKSKFGIREKYVFDSIASPRRPRGDFLTTIINKSIGNVCIQMRPMK